MGILDLECIATGLPIIGGSDTRCVFFLVVGEGADSEPMSLPLAGAWNGYYPELDPGWHETAVFESVNRIVTRAPRTGSAALQPKDLLLEIVSATMSGTARLLTPAGESVTFRAALETFYSVLAAEEPGEDGEGPAASIHELCQSAVRRPDIVELAYAAAPEAELRPACLRFRRFRRWFEASRSWSAAAVGHQLDEDDIAGMVRRAAAGFAAQAGTRPARLAAALADYRVTLEPALEDDDESEEGSGSELSLKDSFAQNRLIEHITETLRNRRGIDAAGLASSIEIFRMIQAVPSSVLPGGGDVAANKARWRVAIERTGTADVKALTEALRGAG